MCYGKNNQRHAISDTMVTSKIYILRNKKIMLDRDLAELYEVETRVLNQAVNRNLEVTNCDIKLGRY